MPPGLRGELEAIVATLPSEGSSHGRRPRGSGMVFSLLGVSGAIAAALALFASRLFFPDGEQVGTPEAEVLAWDPPGIEFATEFDTAYVARSSVDFRLGRLAAETARLDRALNPEKKPQP